MSTRKGFDTDKDKQKRIHRHSVLFNTSEIEAINHYCKKYKVKNRSKLVREAVITTILKKFDSDYPTLF